MIVSARFFAGLTLLWLLGAAFLHSFQPQHISNKWMALSGMRTARPGACSVQLSDGRVLIAGGESGTGALNSAEIVDKAGVSRETAPMSTGRANPMCIALDGGRILMAGGNTSGSALNSAEIFDPNSNAWSALPPMMAARAGAAISMLHSGRVLIAGGENNGSALSSLETFDPVNNRFEAVAGFLSSPRKEAAAACCRMAAC